MQTVKKTRSTKETEIELVFNPKGSGKYEISAGISFFTHMLQQFAYHGGFDLNLRANSLDGNSHHLIEDVAITLGSAFLESLDDKKGIKRYSNVILPMDEALVLCALDLSGRAYCNCKFQINEEKTSDFETVLLPHFYNSFASNALLTMHIHQLEGTDAHHIIECSFKAFAKALKGAIETDYALLNEIPSTKGTL